MEAVGRGRHVAQSSHQVQTAQGGKEGEEMIGHSLVVLAAFLSCIVGPIVLAVTTVQEGEFKPDPKVPTPKDTHFLKG